MNRKHWVGFCVGCLAAVALASAIRPPEVKAQRRAEEAAWEYKVAAIEYNPGERMTEAQHAASFEKVLNGHAREGWEVVGSLLSRSTVQTVGGGVTTRETTSFIALRRPRR